MVCEKAGGVVFLDMEIQAHQTVAEEQRIESGWSLDWGQHLVWGQYLGVLWLVPAKIIVIRLVVAGFWLRVQRDLLQEIRLQAKNFFMAPCGGSW